MADHDEVMKCPLCEGHGELRRSEIVERLTNPEQIDQYLSGTVEEFAGAKARRYEAGRFQKEVHSWNPQLPIFNRSPKE